MAERRMFHKTLLTGNLFTTLSKNAQLLYFHLNLQADDDGVCGNSRAVCRMCGSTAKHLQALIDGGWILEFPQGEVVIVHWHVHNQIRKDRHKPSMYTHVTRCLCKNRDGLYERLPDGCHFDNQLATQERIEEKRKEKVSIDKHRAEEERGKTPAPEAQADSSSAPSAPADDYDIDIDYDRILHYYQAFCTRLEPCEALTPKLRSMIADRVREGYTLLSFLHLFQMAACSEFLAGMTDNRGWRASMEWLLDPMHIRDVESGKYTTWR